MKNRQNKNIIVVNRIKPKSPLPAEPGFPEHRKTERPDNILYKSMPGSFSINEWKNYSRKKGGGF